MSNQASLSIRAEDGVIRSLLINGYDIRKDTSRATLQLNGAVEVPTLTLALSVGDVDADVAVHISLTANTRAVLVWLGWVPPE